MSQPSARLRNLDGLRAVSVGLVIVGHLLEAVGVRMDGGVFASAAVQLGAAELGKLGVHLFFVISGFVICRGLLNGGLAGFWRRRIFRIAPPLVLYVAVVAGLMLAGVVKADPTIARTLTFTCNFGDCGGWLGAHTWSVSVEEQFYLVMPLAFMALRGRVAWAPVVVALAMILVAMSGHPTGLVEPFLPISIGVTCAVAEARIRRTVEAAPWLLPAAVLLMLGALRLADTRLHLAGDLMLSPLVACVVMGVAFMRGRWLSAAPLAAVGEASYGVYLWQQLATMTYDEAYPLVYVLSMAGTILLALVLYRWMERPLIAYSRRGGGNSLAQASGKSVNPSISASAPSTAQDTSV